MGALPYGAPPRQQLQQPVVVDPSDFNSPSMDSVICAADAEGALDTSPNSLSE